MENADDNFRPKQLSDSQWEVYREVRRLDWARDFSQELLIEFAQAATLVKLNTGQSVKVVDDGINSVYFIVAGRVHAAILDPLGRVTTEDWLKRGRALGLFAIGLTDLSNMKAKVVEPTIAIQLKVPELLQLSHHAEFQLALIGIATQVVKRLTFVDRKLPKAQVVGIVHHSEATRRFTVRLANRLSELDEDVAIAGDLESLPGKTAAPYRRLIEQGQLVDMDERLKIIREWNHKGRMLIDVSAGLDHEIHVRLLSYADIVLWCVRPGESAAALERLQRLQEAVPDWKDEVHIVWIIDENHTDNSVFIPPHTPELNKLCDSDFKLSLDEPSVIEDSPPPTRLLSRGLERVVHRLRGIKIGIALGGGAARGMAHLGVLKALEDAGIDIDMVAGTSAGAMTGVAYAAGIEPDYAAECFQSELQPSWIYRHIPAGGYVYLAMQYRRNRFDSMLRKYIHDHRMEQLILPTFSIAVDLVEGIPLIRGEGDAVKNILESINLPPLALPIIDSGRAVVDGGLLNNVPANILFDNGCNFVIASSVTAKLEKDFAGIKSKGRRSAGRFFPAFRVIMRQNLVQSYSMNAIGVDPADFVIAPDVTSFDLAEFTRAEEMAAVGKQTTNDSVAELKRMLHGLDPQLFPL